MPPPSDTFRGVVEENQMVKLESDTQAQPSQAQLSHAQPSHTQPFRDGFNDSAVDDDYCIELEETQGQDTYGSVVDETPYQDIELDTQAQPDAPDTPPPMSQPTHELPEASPAKSQLPHGLSDGSTTELRPPNGQLEISPSKSQPPYRVPEGHGRRVVTPPLLFSRLLIDSGPSPEFKYGRAPERLTAQNLTRFPTAMQQPLASSGPDPELLNMTAPVQLTVSGPGSAIFNLKSQTLGAFSGSYQTHYNAVPPTPRNVSGPAASVSSNKPPARASTASVPIPANISIEAPVLPLALSDLDTVASSMTPPVHPKAIPEEVTQSSNSISQTVASPDRVRKSSRPNFTGFISSQGDDSAPSSAAPRIMEKSEPAPALIIESLQHEIVSEVPSTVKNSQGSNSNRLPQSATTFEADLAILDSTSTATLSSDREQSNYLSKEVTNAEKHGVQDPDESAPSAVKTPKQKPVQVSVPKPVQMKPPQTFKASSLPIADPVLFDESTVTTETTQRNLITNPHGNSVAPRKTASAVKSNQARSRHRTRREQGKSHRAPVKVVVPQPLPKLLITSKKQLQKIEPIIPPMGPKLRCKPFTDVVPAQSKSARLNHLPHEADESVTHPAAHPANKGRQRVLTHEPSIHGDINRPCTPEDCAADVISNGAENRTQEGHMAQNTPEEREFRTETSHRVEENLLGNHELNPGNNNRLWASQLGEELESPQNSAVLKPDPVIDQGPANCRSFEDQEQGRRLSSRPLNEINMKAIGENGSYQRSKQNEQGQYLPSQTSNEIDIEEMDENDVPQDPQPDELSSEMSQPPSQSNSPQPPTREDQLCHGQGSQHHSQLPRSESRRGSSRGIDERTNRQESQRPNSGHQTRNLFRPQSSQGNMSALMSSRPVRNGEIPPSRNSTPALNIRHPQKIQKSSPGKKKTPVETLAALLARQKVHETKGNELRQEILETKLEAMEFLKDQEIKNLRDTNTKSVQTITSLKMVQAEQKEKLVRWRIKSVKYKEHINDVVRDHKYLAAEALRLKQMLKEAKSELTLQLQQDIALQSLIETQKKAEKAVIKSNQKKDEIYLQIKKNSETLAAHVSKLTKSEINLQKSTAELKHRLEVETTKGRRFEQQIEAVNTGRQEFDAILKEIPSSVARELVEKDGILAKLLSSGDATQAKFDEIIASVNSLKDTNVEPSPALTRTLGDFFTKLESKLPSPVVQVTPEPASRTVDDLKEYFSQHINDRLAQENLNRKLSKLETKNAELLDEKKLQELAVQNLTNEKKKLNKELEDEKRNLEEKTREFENLQANPPEDAVLVAKVRDLESKYSAAQQRVDAAAQAAAKDEQELTALKESIAHQKGEIEQLGRTIKSMGVSQEKKDEASRLATQKLREDFEKSQLATKTAMQQEHQLELRKYDQKQLEAESALSQSREEFEKMNGELDKTRAERDKYKGYARDQDARLQRAEQEKPNIEDSQSLRNRMQAAEDGIAVSRRQILSVTEIFTKQNESNSERYKDFSKEIKSTDQLERENETLTRENVILKEKILKGQDKRQLQLRSDESAAEGAPRRDVASNSEQDNLVQRAHPRLAHRKASGPIQFPQNDRSAQISRSDVLTKPQNTNTTSRRVEKSVTFSDEPTYEDSLSSASSPMVPPKANFSNMDSLFDESGILDPLRLKEYQKHKNRSGQERVFLPTEAVTLSDHPVSKTSHTMEQVVDRRREGLKPKSALKPISLRTDQSRVPHALKLSRSTSSQISKIVSGGRSASYQADQTSAQESPRQGSSRRASMKRPSQLNLEPKSTKRRALSKPSSFKLGAIDEVPDSQDAA